MEFQEQVNKVYTKHKNAFESWEYGEPIKAWYDENGDFCVMYESGKWFHYKGIDETYPAWW